ncbi:MAG: hypothetical protein JWM68_3628 [Verrucomicrobiales bacterium]|nr:hypothetical protein [Verrucomicrobiales bacterium]
MKKILAAVAVIVLLFCFYRFSQPGHPPQPDQPTPVAPPAQVAIRSQSKSPAPSNPFLDSEAVHNLRAAVASGNEEAINNAVAGLAQYLAEHPGDTQYFLDALASEKDEPMFGALAKGFAQTDALMKNSGFLKSLANLASQSSPDQRQHILLNCLASAQQIDADMLEAITRIGANDSQSPVQTSAVALLANWMHRFTDDSGVLSEKLGKILDTSTDRTVRAFCYQLLASHRDALPREQQENLLKYFKTENDPVLGNSIAVALSAASSELRGDAVAYLHAVYQAEKSDIKRRYLLAQIACLEGPDALPFLKEESRGTTTLAKDAAQHLSLLAQGGANAESFFLVLNSNAPPDVAEH